MAGNAFLNRIPKSAAISAPVHAPVPGSGIPTKIRSPQNSYFSMLALLLMAFVSSFSTMGLNFFVPFIQSKILVINSNIKGIGNRLPIMQIGTACHFCTSKKGGPAASSPPLSSKIGTIEIIKTISFLLTFPPKFMINQFIKA